MSRVVHIAGRPVKVGHRGRQLCAWCGAKLIDDDFSTIMVASNADGSPGELPRPWDDGALVAVDGSLSMLVPHEDGTDLPDDCCAPSTGLPIPVASVLSLKVH